MKVPCTMERATMERETMERELRVGFGLSGVEGSKEEPPTNPEVTPYHQGTMYHGAASGGGEGNPYHCRVPFHR